MAIDQYCLAETASQRIQLILQEAVVGTVDVIDTTLKLRPVDPPTPQSTVTMGA